MNQVEHVHIARVTAIIVVFACVTMTVVRLMMHALGVVELGETYFRALLMLVVALVVCGLYVVPVVVFSGLKKGSVVGCDSGYCYLRIVREECRSSVKVDCGAWPRLSELLSLPMSVVSVEALCKLNVGAVGERVWHVSDDGVLSMLDLLGSYSLVMDTVVVGSLGFFMRSMMKDAKRRPLLEFDKSTSLFHRIGGDNIVSADLIEKFVAIGDVSLCRAYLNVCKAHIAASVYGAVVSKKGVTVDSALATLENVFGSGVVSVEDSKLLTEVMSFGGEVPVHPVGSCATIVDGVENDDAVNSGAPSPFRGPNWERNKEWREKKKLRKADRQLRHVDWRKRNSNTGMDSGRGGANQGYFSQCPLDVQKELRDTRAALLIAKNKKDLVEVKRREDQLKSSETLIRDTLRLVETSNKLVKKTVDSKVSGWATKITESAVASAANSVPSTMPSLDSIGVTETVSFMDESGKRKNVQVTLEQHARIEAFKTEVNKLYDDLDMYGGSILLVEEEEVGLRAEYKDILPFVNHKIGEGILGYGVPRVTGSMVVDGSELETIILNAKGMKFADKAEVVEVLRKFY